VLLEVSSTIPLRLARTDRVFVLTGAGISAESGIPTFRDAGGLWEKHRIEDVASPEGWHRSAETVWRFYSERRAKAKTVSPNAAHVALARLEEAIGPRLFLCTQNVDALHERGGSVRVCHMHGELMRSRCEQGGCGESFTDDRGYATAAEIPSCTTCGARIRPHICWFGETPFEMDAILEALETCDWFVTIGSSGAVYPAAGFVRAVKARGRAKTIYAGIEAPENARVFDEVLLGKATDVVPTLVERMISGA
jgi:NAD-dependent deacetylase